MYLYFSRLNKPYTVGILLLLLYRMVYKVAENIIPNKE